jgi:hypothetical protein
MKHRCGGELQPTKVKIQKKVGYYFQTFTVDGYKCDYCGDETILRDTAFEIDRVIEQLRRLWKDWRIPSDTKVTGKYIKEQLFEDNTYVRV